MTLIRLLSVLVLVCALPLSAQAADEKKKDEKKSTPITEWIDAENALLDSLPQQNQKVFFILRNKHSVIRSVNIVRRDVKNAVTACGKENSDLKKPMRNRFKDWENAVLPILKEAEKFLKTELKEQEAFHVGDYKHVIKLNDKAYDFSESQVQKTPVTTEEACQSLLDSMDNTEDKLVTLLQEILLPEEVVRERLEQVEKAKEKSKAKK